MKKDNNSTSKAQNFEWAYSKVAYFLDVEEVIWPTVDAVKANGVETPEQLVKAVLEGEVKTWPKGPKVTKKGLKQLFMVLRNQCGVNAAALAKAAKLYA